MLMSGGLPQGKFISIMLFASCYCYMLCLFGFCVVETANSLLYIENYYSCQKHQTENHAWATCLYLRAAFVIYSCWKASMPPYHGPLAS